MLNVCSFVFIQTLYLSFGSYVEILRQLCFILRSWVNMREHCKKGFHYTELARRTFHTHAESLIHWYKQLAIVICAEPTSLSDWQQSPTVLRYMHWIGLDAETGLDTCSLVGVVFAFGSLVWKFFRNSVSYFVLWILYLSIFHVRIVSGYSQLM